MAKRALDRTGATLEHTTTRLIDDALSETTIMFDLATQFLDRQLGNWILGANFAGVPQLPSGTLHDFIGDADELAIFSALLRLSFGLCHPLELLHPPAPRAGAIAKPLDWPLDCRRQPR